MGKLTLISAIFFFVIGFCFHDTMQFFTYRVTAGFIRLHLNFDDPLIKPRELFLERYAVLAQLDKKISKQFDLQKNALIPIFSYNRKSAASNEFHLEFFSIVAFNLRYICKCIITQIKNAVIQQYYSIHKRLPLVICYQHDSYLKNVEHFSIQN